MRRRLLNIAAALSLIACLAICAIWVRSFYWTDQKTIQTPAAFYEIMSGSGGVVLYRLRPPDGEVRWVRGEVKHSFLGAEVIEGRLARRRPWVMLILPYWLPAGAAAILPGLWILARASRERRARVTRCPVCGMELTGAGVPPSPCPSCGWAPSSRTPPVRAPSPASSTVPLTGAASAAAPAPPPATARNPKPVAYRRAI